MSRFNPNIFNETQIIPDSDEDDLFENSDEEIEFLKDSIKKDHERLKELLAKKKKPPTKTASEETIRKKLLEELYAEVKAKKEEKSPKKRKSENSDTTANNSGDPDGLGI